MLSVKCGKYMIVESRKILDHFSCMRIACGILHHFSQKWWKFLEVIRKCTKFRINSAVVQQFAFLQLNIAILVILTKMLFLVEVLLPRNLTQTIPRLSSSLRKTFLKTYILKDFKNGLETTVSKRQYYLCTIKRSYNTINIYTSNINLCTVYTVYLILSSVNLLYFTNICKNFTADNCSCLIVWLD
jgi:hypothetical protein